MADVVETLKRIEAHKDVIGIIVVNAEEPLRQIAMMARSTVRDIDPQNDLRFLRIRTKDYQILVAVDNDFLLITIQMPSK
ncbi:dynein light chain roadblock-type 2-like isoform X2 [Labrus mixtus]|uniref:dynein light chain roadblock-type 2-like isoform X2 n=1 Tax=Labrus mixtus TaxID=508554 RepID=UPI0029C00B8B|nr:dynein light chain roadblock-type 2-like isoform X2 [Labrus mixtus]